MLRNKCCFMKGINLSSILCGRPDAVADITGSSAYPDIKGMVRFYQLDAGVIVETKVRGLPDFNGKCQSPVFGYHIHGGMYCSGNSEDAFADALTHYNPEQCQHPFHAGDLAPLFGNCGYALSVFLSDRFCVEDVIGRTVIIHLHPDDFHTQPAGESGMKIACGMIKRCL